MFRFDKRILYIFLIICVLGMFTRYLSNSTSVLALILTIPAVLIAITFHEYAHAFVAYKLGDDTAKMQGRLSLNPLKHMDPIGIVMLLFLGFGWGKPVEVDSRNFKRNMPLTKAEAIVAIAGPIANFVLAIIFTIIIILSIKFNWLDALSLRTTSTILSVLTSIVSINIGLGIFNLIPLPPLDGSKVLNHFLPYKARLWFDSNGQIFYMIFLIIWITGIAGAIISPAIYTVYYALIKLFAMIFGVVI